MGWSVYLEIYNDKGEKIFDYEHYFLKRIIDFNLRSDEKPRNPQSLISELTDILKDKEESINRTLKTFQTLAVYAPKSLEEVREIINENFEEDSIEWYFELFEEYGSLSYMINMLEQLPQGYKVKLVID